MIALIVNFELNSNRRRTNFFRRTYGTDIISVKMELSYIRINIFANAFLSFISENNIERWSHNVVSNDLIKGEL